MGFWKNIRLIKKRHLDKSNAYRFKCFIFRKRINGKRYIPKTNRYAILRIYLKSAISVPSNIDDYGTVYATFPGFGDIVPTEQVYMFFTMAYIIFGLSL